MIDRVHNFSAGPAALPLPVLQKAQEELLALPGVGSSVMEISHRSKAFSAINQEANDNLRQLLNVPENYKILFLQGGARLQFGMIPLNFLADSPTAADYVLTGSWGKHACKEAKLVGDVNVVWDGGETNYDRLPSADQLQLNADAPYVHFTSNETIQGVQFDADAQMGNAPWVCDASSDILCRPVPIEKYGLIYACAQKNVGPAGVTLVIIRDDLIEKSNEKIPTYLNYAVHAKGDSLYNTPPSFAVYMVGLVAKWLLEDIGGLAKMEETNQQKAAMLYEAIDASNGFYAGHAQPECRSIMNVAFRLPSDELQDTFLAEAAENKLTTLKGHRSVGGIRASIYNAMPTEGVAALRDFMKDFAAKNS